MAALGFTPASGQDLFSIEETEPSSSKTGIALNGEEVRQFYEDLMKESQGRDASRRSAMGEHRSKRRSGESSRRARRRAGAQSAGPSGIGGQRDAGRPAVMSESTMELLGLRLLRCAHEGDSSGLKDLLSKGVDINVQDTYFWTAVMCASWSGQSAAVRLLLRHGAAWVGVVDTRGRDAKDLALEAGHNEVLEELESYGRSPHRDTPSDCSAAPAQWCAVCRSEYSDGLSSHESSTLHQFSLRRAPPTPYYCLPPSSNSYKMMVRCGWKPGSGLGPEGEGPQQPVPTVLKRDQTGLGFGHTKRAKVTHFQPRDCDAVKLPSNGKGERGGKGQRKEDRRRKELYEKNWERDFRASFNL
ncbi:G patch domain and ankyrin repeat-containing protein 1 [Pseudoliparis swirei]|uniref:G patch domain and ankyrin repeat-containing protein 1 n=1 Tax=Pseudoliparis swirei TaxID=2059687 RepID=UPI0024BDA259|nr:G patch domain and ankyrin repeat-containing protein 1 [Pseudoliparis swirei]